MSENLLGIKSITSQTTVYEPPDSLYWYQIKWDNVHGYSVQRRLAPEDKQVINYTFWSRSGSVENWVEMNGGTFDSSWSSRPIRKFKKLNDAEKIILNDIKNPQSKGVQPNSLLRSNYNIA